MHEEIKRVSGEYLKFCKLFDGRYRILSTLGNGRYGRVMLALDCKTQAIVAIKKLTGACQVHRLEIFLSEISVLSHIRNESERIAAPRLRDFKIDMDHSIRKPLVYYVMDFVELGEFVGFVAAAKELSEPLACFFVKQIVACLANLHDAGVLHLDLKPENILIDELGKLYLCDFGSAVQLSREAKRKPSLIGSEEYMAPEALDLFAGAGPLDLEKLDMRKLDSFSLGVILFVILHKSNPFKRASPDDAYFRRFLKDRRLFWRIFPRSESLSREAADLVERLLESNAEERAQVDETALHPWFLASTASHSQIKSELQSVTQVIRAEFFANLKETLRARKNSFQSQKNKKTCKKYSTDDLLRLQDFILEKQEVILRLHEALRLDSDLLHSKPSKRRDLKPNSPPCSPPDLDSSAKK